MNSESLLPRDQKIDSFLEEWGDEVRQEIEDRRLGEADILDPHTELTDYDSFKFFAQFIEQQVLCVSDAPTRQAVYRAMAFSYEVSQVIHEKNAQFNAVPFIESIMSCSEREDYLRHETQQYLANNPNIHDVIQYYLDDIDLGNEKPVQIEMSAALIFMLVERNIGDMFLRESSQNVSMEQFES